MGRGAYNSNYPAGWKFGIKTEMIINHCSYIESIGYRSMVIIHGHKSLGHVFGVMNMRYKK